MISGLETLAGKQIEKHDLPIVDESLETKELNNNIEDNKESHIDPPDITYIERTSRPALILMERFLINAFETNDSDDSISESTETKSEGSTNEEKPKIFEIPMPETQEPLETISFEKLIPTSDFFPRTGGEWDGEAGDSKWYPNRDTEPGDRNGTNPEHKTWGEILDKYKIDGISFHNGEPDFSEISKGNVEIDDFTDSRDSNFDQADEKLAKQRGCTPEEVAEWRKENGYTWHECSDRKTMQKVPTEVHGNIPHSGGISEQKSKSQDA